MTAEHVYQIYIRAEIEDVWHALTDPDSTRQYFHATHWTTPPVAGEAFQTHLPDGTVAVDGMVEEVDPPHRLVHTWRAVYDEELGAEPASRVSWILTRAGEGLTHLRLVHDRLESSPLTEENVRDGWVWILDSLKSLLETGSPLPRATLMSEDEPAST
ncbi:SRPBCC family protein [Knoellia sinensis]|uniref:SRPBCC family protein n=1 Tax=Knoellia sinensis TaxID=136100 RepID=UPI00068FB332|nr:SRPBCC family protein [Knoellia sinensis]